MSKKIATRTKAEKEVEARGLMELGRALLRALRKLWRMLFGGTAGDLATDFTTAKGLAGRAVIGAAHGVEGVGKTLGFGHRLVHGAASAVGSTLGALLTRAPIGPREVANAAVANDNATAARLQRRVESQRARRLELETATDPAEVAALAMESAAQLAARGRDAGATRMSPQLPSDVSIWLMRLDAGELRAVMAAGPEAVQSHILGTGQIEGVQAVAFPSAALGLASPSLVDAGQFAEMLKKARAGLAASKHEAETASRRGVRHRTEMPLYEDEPAAAFPTRRVGAGIY
ncbi:hypothetical protein [Methylobacterium sp. AMS5]|uniref:hypothetical protein n=1 Tax=Methylobacterium sp. AMS5 TaxID=925818 RepID=UPI00074FAB22|nr:hypothetical protein [Methylobacterium sp. AMS5]AMB45076.1 hypothetical protein Y590_09210 [Methylobacterium sp. AMS5]